MELITLPSFTLMGLKARTSLSLESNPMTSQIIPTVTRYFQEGVCAKIAGRTKPGTTYMAYAEYESDFTGPYTYYIGEVVDARSEAPQGLFKLEIPEQSYSKITNGPGPMPGVCIQTWQKIWLMQEEELGGDRAYIADFEVYDERAKDYQNTILDIFVGLKK